MKTIELKDFCKGNLLDDKLFIVPTRTIGMQMINKMAREGSPSINLRAVTLKRLAFEILEEDLIKKEILVIDSILGNNIIMDVLKGLAREDEKSFFKANLIDTRTAEEIYKVIIELKYSGLEEFPELKDLNKIYDRYEEKLKELNALDYCDIIRLAMDSPRMESYQDKKIGIASNIEFHNLEEKFFEKLTEKNVFRIEMPVGSLRGQPRNYYYRDQATVSEIKDKSIRFYEGYGSGEEIRFIIDDIKRNRIPIDQVVIGYTSGKYVDLLNLEFEKEKIAIGFGEGLGIGSSSIFRFINTIFTWARNYYNVNEIRPIFANGDIIVEDISAPALYEELVECKILSLRDNYYRLLGLDEEDNFHIENDISLPEARKKKRIWLKDFFKELFEAIPYEDRLYFHEYIPKLRNLLKKYVKNLHKYDGVAMEVVFQTLDRIEKIHMELNRDEYFDIILSYMEKARIIRSQPQPGHVFASNFRNAGYTGRKHLYLIGLDSDSLSNKVVESPILLDKMRGKISPQLSIANEAYEYKKYKIREVLTADFDHISIGYSNFDTVDIKAKSPSQIYNELKDSYGKVDLTEAEIKPRRVLGRDLVKSATALETLAECSRKFYFQYKMNLKPKEDVEIRVDRWLDGISKGNIIHHVLNRYFDLDIEEQRKETLVDFIEEACLQAENENIYLLQDIHLREKENLLKACENIIDITRTDKEWKVLVNELSFGRGKDNRIFGKLPKQTIDILGLELDISGAIDRVDISREDENLLRIVDYKTGNMDNFSKKLRISTGRGRNRVDDYSQTQKLQYYIYKKALEKILEKRKDVFPQAKIEKFTYIFEGHEKNGIIDLDFNEDFIDTIEKRIKELLDTDLLESENQIIYDPEDALRCKYCDYKSICLVDKDLSLVEEGFYD